MKTCIAFVVMLLPTLAAVGQDTVRTLTGPGQFTKYLTPGQLDEWVFDGEKGETIIAHVATRDFDSILALAAKDAKQDALLVPEVDDEGSDSRFAFRLPEKGQYKIRVHAFKFQGGGNYELYVQRFMATPVELGKPFVGTFDQHGKSYHYFQGVKDRILTTEVRGASGAWKMLDFKGRELADWNGAVTIQDDGEHFLELSGRSGAHYDLAVREARRQTLGEGKALTAVLPPGQMDVWSFSGRQGDFRLIEVQKKGELTARVIFAPLDKKQEKRLAQADEWPEIRFLPVASSGGHLRFAVFLGREGRYQLQLQAPTPVSYSLQMADPSQAIEEGKEGHEGHDASGILPVGGAAFYSFKALPGQLIHATLDSQKFVPQLQLYDSRGNLVEKSEASGDDLASHIAHMVVKEGTYRLQVSSLGDGGGGDFHLALGEMQVKELALGGRSQGALHPGSTDFWSFAGKEGQTVFLNVRSLSCEASVSLRSPDGVELESHERGAEGIGTLLAVKLPKSGRYTAWITSRHGAGDYTARLIDGD